jgi:hypothetical protein
MFVLRKPGVSLLASVAFLLPWHALCEDHPLAPCEGDTGEIGFRSNFVKFAVTPSYPEFSIRVGHQGIVVARVCLGDRATTATSMSATSVEILTAPDAQTAKAMKEALAKWRFIPPVRQQGGHEVPLKLASKITYYFVKQGQQWAVLSPTESFYVGPRFALAQQMAGENANPSQSKRR